MQLEVWRPCRENNAVHVREAYCSDRRREPVLHLADDVRSRECSVELRQPSFFKRRLSETDQGAKTSSGVCWLDGRLGARIQALNRCFVFEGTCREISAAPS